MEFRSQFRSITVDPVQDRLAEDEVYQRADRLLDSLKEEDWLGTGGHVNYDALSPLQRVLHQNICDLVRKIGTAVEESDQCRRKMEIRDAEAARVREELSAVLDAWPVEVVEEAPPVTGLSPVEEAPRHHDRDGYCDNPARGY